jgi:hypothetical protein
MTVNQVKVNSSFTATFKNIENDAKGQPLEVVIVDIVSECGKVRKSRHKIGFEKNPELFIELKENDKIFFEADYQERLQYAEGYQLFSPKNVRRLS